MLQAMNAIQPLEPMLKAYALGYLTSITPRMLGLLRMIMRKDISLQEKVNLLSTILQTSAQFHRFPTSCGIIVGGATALPRLLTALLRWTLQSVRKENKINLGQTFDKRLNLICTFVSACLAFDMLNKDQVWARKRAVSRSMAADSFHKPASHGSETSTPIPPTNRKPLPIASSELHYAGRTIDFTLFTFCRALDVAVITLWTRTRSSSLHPEQHSSRLSRLLRELADPTVFSTSTAVIMWSWFYSPYRLPRSYNHWISKAADIDDRLIEALRRARQGEFIYGQETGQTELLAGLCKELKLPIAWADPKITIPIPCELYHCGRGGKSCEVHALSRAWTTWVFAMQLYTPLQLLGLIRRNSGIGYIQRLEKAFGSAMSSSSFLAAFVGLFYYSVCLARTRLGPTLLSSETVTPQMWDSGLCILAGCLTCGWSILVEKPSKRQEIAFFVAPRALATVIPRVYDQKYQRREKLVFATSVAIVLSALKQDDGRSVRGVLGRVLRNIIKE